MMRNWRALKQELSHMQEVDIATFIESLPSDQALAVFRMLDKDIAAEVFSNLTPERMQQLIGRISDEELRAIMSDLMVDDAVDMLEEMPANVVRRVLSHTSVQDRQLINQFLRYPENSAGSIMTAEYVRLKKSMSVAQAIRTIRQAGEDSETVYTCYVTDEAGKLEGVITVKRLLLSGDEEKVDNLMEKDVLSVRTDADQEEAASVISRYDLLALPVIDKESRLVGIITFDDVMDVVEEENTEDIEKMSALSPSDKPYLSTGVFSLVRNRIGWLLFLMALGMGTGLILGSFRDVYIAIPVLVTFIPLLTDAGGNAGSQSSALIIRGMSVGEIDTSDWLKVLWKEVRVGLTTGLVLAVVDFLWVFFMGGRNLMLAFSVSLSLYMVVLFSKAFGGLLPIAAKKCGLDPAIASSPLISTICDAVGILICFSLVSLMLGV